MTYEFLCRTVSIFCDCAIFFTLVFTVAVFSVHLIFSTNMENQ